MPLIDRLTSRLGAWITLALALLITLGAMGALSTVEAPPRAGTAPSTSESAQVADLAARFPDADIQGVLLVGTRTDGGALTPADRTALHSLGAQLPEVPGHPVSPALVSQDGEAAMVQVPLRAGHDNSENARTITAMRDVVHDKAPTGLSVQVTGGPAFGADIAKAFDGANFTLLIVTVAVVALLLLLTYRSPVLWLVPVVVVGLADQLAAVVTKGVGSAFDLSFDAGIVSVLVFGAGTNYAMLLISRYREELHRHADHRTALRSAWRATVPAIVASNATVVVALASLVLASIPGTRGLGVASAVGLLIVLAAVLLVLPAALAVVGRGVFWPKVPRVLEAGASTSSLWGSLAKRVMARPVVVVSATLALLAVLAGGLLGTKVGLTQTEQFRVASESAQGLEVLGEHFPAGAAQPLTVVANADRLDAVSAALRDVTGVTSVRTVPGEATNAQGVELGQLSVVTEADPGSAAAREGVEQIRSVAHAVPGADALVGGQQAVDVDARDGNQRDLLLIAPIVLIINALVLTLLTRSAIAPIVLLGVNILSSLATIGAGSWIGEHLLGWSALDLQVPLLAFLFLVALGIDYTIFLVHRARTESEGTSTREGMIRAVAGTGAVITSAGIVLAAVFAALAVLPLVALGQLGLIVGLGVVIDTFVVRTILVPGLFGLIGDRIWWPGRRGSEPVAADATREPEVTASTDSGLVTSGR